MHKHTNAHRHTHTQYAHIQHQAGHSYPEETILAIWYNQNKAQERFYMACIVYLPINYHTPTYLIQQGSVFYYCSFFVYPPCRCRIHRHWNKMCTGFIFHNKVETNNDQYLHSISTQHAHVWLHGWVRWTLEHVCISGQTHAQPQQYKSVQKQKEKGGTPSKQTKLCRAFHFIKI